MRRTHVRQWLGNGLGVRLLGSAVLALAALSGCGDDDSSTTDATPASATLKALSAKELTSLCKDLLPIVRSSSTPAHQCTLLGVSDTEDEKSCAAAKQSCLEDKTYDDWSKASCKDFAADGGKPTFDCSTKVSEIKSCYESAAKWLNALNCKAADPADTSFDPPPSCFDKLQTGDCKFELADLMEDQDFVWEGGSGIPRGNTYMCVDGSKKYEYDLGFGDTCNECATGKNGCCDSWVSCVNDEACRCFADCLDTDEVCFKNCKISDFPPAFVRHVDCVADTCATQCDL